MRYHLEQEDLIGEPPHPILPTLVLLPSSVIHIPRGRKVQTKTSMGDLENSFQKAKYLMIYLKNF